MAIFNGTMNDILDYVVNHNVNGISVDSPANVVQRNTVSGSPWGRLHLG